MGASFFMRSYTLRSLFFFITPLSGRGLPGQDVFGLIRTQEKINQAGSLLLLLFKARRMSIKNNSDINQMDDPIIPPGLIPSNIKIVNIFADVRSSNAVERSYRPSRPVVMASRLINDRYCFDKRCNALKMATTSA